jgi:hypothetical protein
VRLAPSCNMDARRLRIKYFIDLPAEISCRQEGETYMFANPQFTHKNAPLFLCSARYETENIFIPALRPSIMNDEDSPPKALIELDMFLIPMHDFRQGDKWKTTYYDLEASVCLTPEHAIKLVRHLNRLISEIFNDHNYVNDGMKARKAKVKKQK